MSTLVIFILFLLQQRSEGYQWPNEAMTKVIRSTFGRHTPIQRCQVHKARNVIDRLPKPLHASARKALRQAWELDDADKAERRITPSIRPSRNLRTT